MKTEVIIVGAGPTGLMAANQLQRFGIDFIILDSKPGPTEQSRAIALTARSCEIYQQMGLSDSIIKNGTRINSFNLYSGGKRKAEVKIGEIGIGLSDFHYLLAFEQNKNENLLFENLTNNGSTVLWNTEFISLKEDVEGVEVLAKSKNENIRIRGKYLIGCDGAKSPIRHQLKFNFDGGTYENKFFVVDVIMNWNLEYDKLIVSPADKNFCGFFPLKGEKCYRILGTLPKQFSENENINFADLEKVIKETLKLEIHFEKVNWFSVYKLHHRCVDTFNKGSVFLAGDSAHIHSPAGGQGMNTGLQDAYNLCWKLAMVLKKQAHPNLLNTYNEERLPFAQWLMKYTDRGFTFMTSSNWFIANLRKYVGLNLVGFIISRKRIRPRIFSTVSQIWYSYNGKSLAIKSFTTQKLLFKAGDRLPFIVDNYYLQFTKPSFHLIHIGNNKLEALEISRLNDIFPVPVAIVENELNENWKKFGVNKELFILVRPDNYIALIFDEINRTDIASYFIPYLSKN